MSLVEVSEPGWATRLLGSEDYEQVSSKKFATRSRLGNGSYGKVYSARNTRDGARWTCAVKLMESKSDDKVVLAYWAKEAHIWGALCPHPNILQLHKVYYGKVGPLQKVAMENELADRDLRAFIIHYACVDLEDARAWTLDLCTGLGHVHSNRIAHRDIKPANCLLKHQPGALLRLVIGDFGQGAVLHRADALEGKEAAGSHSRSLIESPCTWEYAAPEVVHKHGYDFKLDVWSAGVILWQMLQAPI